MSKVTRIAHPRDSWLLRQLFPKRSELPSVLLASSHQTHILHATGRIALLAFTHYILSLFFPILSASIFLPYSKSTLILMPFGITLLCAFLALLFFRRTPTSSNPFFFAPAVVLILCAGAIALPLSVAMFLPVGLFWAFSMFCFEPYFEKVRARSRREEAHTLLIFSSVPFFLLLGVPLLFPSGNAFLSVAHLFFCFASSALCFMAFHAYRSFSYYVTAYLQATDPSHSTDRSLFAMLILLCFFPLCIFDGKGFLLSGNAPPSKNRK